MQKFDDLINLVSANPNSKVLVRTDYNVPIHQGEIIDETRIDKSVAGIDQLLKAGAKVILISHFGRPKEPDQENSLRVISDVLAAKHFSQVCFFNNPFDQELKQKLEDFFAISSSNNLVMLENLRFDKREKANDPELIEFFASIADYYVFDAFSCSHRSHCSCDGLIRKMNSFAGILLVEEIDGISLVANSKTKPLTSIIGGAKISTKFPLLMSLKQKCDYLLIGGAMANTILKAQGYEVGRSLVEADYLDQAKQLISSSGLAKVVLPSDLVVKEASGKIQTKDIDSLDIDDIAYDIGAKSIADFSKIVFQSKNIIWNGPLGLFEESAFRTGTSSIAKQIAKSSGISVAGGGETLAAIKLADCLDGFTYLSTSGGAFIEFIKGDKLPGLDALGYYN